MECGFWRKTSKCQMLSAQSLMLASPFMGIYTRVETSVLKAPVLTELTDALADPT